MEWKFEIANQQKAALFQIKSFQVSLPPWNRKLHKYRELSLLVVLWGHTWVLSYCRKVILICKSLFQNNTLVSDLILISVLCSDYYWLFKVSFYKHFYLVTHCNIFIIIMVLSFNFRVQHEKPNTMIAEYSQPIGINKWIMQIGIFCKYCFTPVFLLLHVFNCTA